MAGRRKKTTGHRTGHHGTKQTGPGSKKMTKAEKADERREIKAARKIISLAKTIESTSKKELRHGCGRR